MSPVLTTEAQHHQNFVLLLVALDFISSRLGLFWCVWSVADEEFEEDTQTSPKKTKTSSRGTGRGKRGSTTTRAGPKSEGRAAPKKQPKPVEDNEPVNIMDDNSQSVSPNLPSSSTAQPQEPQTKKRKLPTIPKKSRNTIGGDPAAPSSSTSQPSTTVASSRPSLASSVSKPDSTKLRGSTSTDFDLRDASVYQSLFGGSKGTGSKLTPTINRVGVGLSSNTSR